MISATVEGGRGGSLSRQERMFLFIAFWILLPFFSFCSFSSLVLFLSIRDLFSFSVALHFVGSFSAIFFSKLKFSSSVRPISFTLSFFSDSIQLLLLLVSQLSSSLSLEILHYFLFLVLLCSLLLAYLLTYSAGFLFHMVSHFLAMLRLSITSFQITALAYSHVRVEYCMSCWRYH